MRVLMINGSSRENGNTATGLREAAKVLEEEGIKTELVTIPGTPVRDCIGCRACHTGGNGHCVFNDDIVNSLIDKAAESDGFIFGTPVYYGHPSGRVLSVLDRMFFAADKTVFNKKPGASVAVARRSGTTASFDVMNKYFTISEMPVVSSTYWNNLHGAAPGEAMQDEEGLRTMRNLGRNMAWMLKCIEAGKKAGINPPETERGKGTNFIR